MAVSAYSTHFDAIAEDGRFARLPLAAASSLMAAGYGYGAEGDALTAALMSAARNLLGETQFTEMYAMDFPTDSILMSHMGEGNWRLARPDRPVRLIKRPLGIGGLDDPPTFLFQYAVGPATLATLVALGGERFRLVVAEGEILDTDELPSARDAVRPVPAGRRGAAVHGRLAPARRPASPGPESRPSRRGLEELLRAVRDRVRPDLEPVRRVSRVIPLGYSGPGAADIRSAHRPPS